MRRLLIVLALAMTVVACSEKPQAATQRKADGHAFEGTGSTGSTEFTAPGWKPGDATSWDLQMKARSQNQNEYSRTSAP